MRELLLKCETSDFEYISETLDSYVSLTDDSKRKKVLREYSTTKSSKDKNDLVDLIDKQIRYFGSADIPYMFRQLFESDAGIKSGELINDICKKLKVSIKAFGTVEEKVERLVKSVVEKELLSKSPSELRKAFKDLNIGDSKIDEILDFLKRNGKVAVLPILLEVLGPVITIGIIETIIISLIATIIGREAAKQIFREVMKRNPWLNALGPIVWVLSAGWLAFDLQGPAYRKTVPIVLFLGIVALRDGSVDENI